MRIGAGFLKGRFLKTPRGKKIRPTSDKVKAACFNIIGESLENTCFLDLFSGTGNIGLEAISRGAGCSVFVENNRLSLKILLENIKLTAAEGRTRVLPLDILKALKLLSREGKSFGIVYLDPPFDYPDVIKVLRLLFRGALVKEGGIVVLERSIRSGGEGLEEVPFYLWKERVYGNVVLIFLKNERNITSGKG